MTDTQKIVLPFIGSIFGTLLTIFINNRINKSNKNALKVERVRLEMYTIIEEVFLYAFHSMARELAGRYRYAFHKIKPDEDFDRLNYLKYINDSELYSVKFDEARVKLFMKFGELQEIWNNPWEISEIRRLINSEAPTIIKKYDNVFTASMDEIRIEFVYKEELDKIVPHMLFDSYGKNLITIQSILLPLLTKDKIESTKRSLIR